MVKVFIAPILALMLFSINPDAQSCPTSKSEKIAVLNNNLQTTKTIKFKITGLTCAGCSNIIYEELKKVDGVIEHSVEYPGDIAIIQFDTSKTNVKVLKEIIEKKGYKVEIIKDKD